MQSPFELLEVCWPRPVKIVDWRWVSEPEWDGTPMNNKPLVNLKLVEGKICWAIDWRDFFRTGVRTNAPFDGGEMSGFHVVFRILITESGTLRFWDDDGCVIRRNGATVHDDRQAHALTQHCLEVYAGEILDVAHFQCTHDWLWCASMAPRDGRDPHPDDEFLRLLPDVRARLAHPTGPVLKMYTNAAHPFRVATSIYSLVLNGYSPSAVNLYGDEQWSQENRAHLKRLLPFARVVSQMEFLQHVRAFGGAELSHLVRSSWYVAKAFVALAAPPQESCVIDDDIFILDSLDDALSAFQECDLVFAPDQDLSNDYFKTWKDFLPCREPLRNGRFNAGLYWIKNIPSEKWITRAALRCRLNPWLPFLWEQGLLSMAYADRRTKELPRHRYNFPLFDGLPGGTAGYDYGTNPCGFSAIHFGGLAEKPSDALSLQLIGRLAARRTNPVLDAELIAAS